MSEDSELRFDIPALFEATRNEFELDEVSEVEELELDWVFFFQSEDVEALHQAAEALQADFEVNLHAPGEEDVDTDDPDSDQNLAFITAHHRGALTVSEVEEIATALQQLAGHLSISYEGVTCSDPEAAEEFFSWFPPEDALDRLELFSASGLEENAELPWCFLIGTSDFETVERIAAELDSLGFDDRDEFDMPNEEGQYGLCVYMIGRNNPSELQATCQQISDVAQRCGGELDAVQFYTREMIEEIFEEE